MNEPDCQCSLCGNEHYTRSSYEVARENVPNWDVLNASLAKSFAHANDAVALQDRSDSDVGTGEGWAVVAGHLGVGLVVHHSETSLVRWLNADDANRLAKALHQAANP